MQNSADALREGTVIGRANHIRLIRKDGRQIPIDKSAAPIRSEDGKIVGAILTFRDVTEEREAKQEREARLITEERLRASLQSKAQLEAAEARFRGLLEAAPDAIVVVRATSF